MLWGTNRSTAWLYRIAGVWGICLTNLEEAPISVDGGRWWLLWCNLGWHRGPPPVNHQLQELDRKLASIHHLLLGWFNGSMWWLKIEFDGYLGFRAFLKLRAKIRAQSAGIYRGFGTYA
jgi:hypothetical protein